MNAAPPLALDEFLRLMPKAELHCHLFGTIRPATLVALAAKAGAPIPSAEIEGWYVRGPKPRGVLHAFRELDARIVTEADDLARIAREYLEDARAHSVRYAELFWNPTGTAKLSGIAFSRAQAAILGAFADAERDLGIVARLIPSIDREAPPSHALEMVEWMIAARADATIGLGMDYREPDGPPERFVEAYACAKRAGFRLTAHAGEFGCPAANVATALDVLGVDRIDHGYTVLDDPALARRCAESGILFTVVPTNSYYLRTLEPHEWAAKHPIRRMPGAGLRVHPNTDDPTFHDVTPTGAWLMMHRDFGFGLDDLRRFMLDGLDGAWIDDARRRRWRAEWSAEFDALRARLES